MKTNAATILLATFELACFSHAFTTNPSRCSHGNRGAAAVTGSARRPFDAARSAAASSRLNSGNSDSWDDSCDVLVLGSGPAGCAIASLLGSNENLDVVVANAKFEDDWVPNYGVWQDEWKTVLDRFNTFGIDMEADGVIDQRWSITDCFFGGSYDMPNEQRTRLDRPYCRVNRFALKKSLSKKFRVVEANHISKAIGINMYSPAGSLVHDESGTTIQLQPKGPDASPLTMRAKIIIDTTGHETTLVMKDTIEPHTPPGFQIAYGALVELDESKSSNLSMIGPYDKEAMTLFDYRTDHFDGNESDTIKATKAPTFMYVMPLGGNKVFFEETSLVARPAVSFQECKDRCFTRLKHLGIDVANVEEEEYCYIPMGGALPARDQRILGIGGAAAVVHPSTGYNLCRTLMGATDAAREIEKELATENPNLDRAVASAYNALWSTENIKQRNFAVFGGEFLMKQDVVGLRGFFDGFFKLPLELWGGFLAGWPGLAYNENHESWDKRIWYGLNFLVKIPPTVALDMFTSIVSYSVFGEGWPLIQSVTPFLDDPPSYEYKPNTDRIGDVAAKQEAVKMIRESKALAEMPTEVAITASSSEMKEEVVEQKVVDQVEVTVNEP